MIHGTFIIQIYIVLYTMNTFSKVHFGDEYMSHIVTLEEEWMFHVSVQGPAQSWMQKIKMENQSFIVYVCLEDLERKPLFHKGSA